MNQAGALPLRQTDKFRIEGEVDPPAYLYVVWVDPGHDVTPVYPWDPEKGWGSRPTREEQTGKWQSFWYTAQEAKPGVATMVMFARSTPLDVPDEEVKGWFEALPELPLPPDGETGVVWFDDYRNADDPLRRGTFKRAESHDPFERWQEQLRKSLGERAAFVTTVSFARTGNK
jgi:hypothetical protein